MSIAFASALEKEVKELKKELKNDLDSLEEFLTEESITEYEQWKNRVVQYFEHDIEHPVIDKTSKNDESSLLSNLDYLGLSFEQNDRAEADIRQIRSDLEPFYRKVQLFKPNNEESFIQTIWWFSQQGNVEILDFLRQIKDKPPFQSGKIMSLLRQAETEICRRECQGLWAFYCLNPEELMQAIEKMLVNKKEEPFAPLPELFSPISIEKAISQLEETKRMIQKVYKPDELKDWLATPNRNFLNESPQNVIIKGKIFRILQHFIRLGEGIS
jgi:hypothetical protein